MASATVVTAVEARLASVWAHGDCPVVTDPLAVDAPADASSFLKVQYPVAIEESMSVGSPGANVQRESGTIRFVIHARRTAAGIVTGRSYMDELRGLFRWKDFGGIRTQSASPPVEDNDSDAGNYFVLAAIVGYEYDILA